jgi:hypothetical protein
MGLSCNPQDEVHAQEHPQSFRISGGFQSFHGQKSGRKTVVMKHYRYTKFNNICFEILITVLSGNFFRQNEKPNNPSPTSSGDHGRTRQNYTDQLGDLRP